VIIIPAIDLKGGRCVRLAQGDFNRTTVYGEHPAEVARRWQDKGAERLHVVDLDGSLAGVPRNREAIRDIISAVNIPVELGGGIRDMDTIADYLSLGVRWIILGTAALRNPELVQDACRSFADQIILGIDARDEMVAVQGWTETTSLAAVDLIRSYGDCRISAVVYTDIRRDGMETGVNIEATKALACAVEIPVIASGGVGGIRDIEKLLEIEDSGVIGVIAGRALYTGALSLEEAIEKTKDKKEV
jgi:phosphoribosylformimino-5-aminoimidazole carboxamide ribotide isomerase